jgi:hypothetical protein
MTIFDGLVLLFYVLIRLYILEYVIDLYLLSHCRYRSTEEGKFSLYYEINLITSLCTEWTGISRAPPWKSLI